MKKMITMILALACLFSLAACGKQNDSAGSETANSVEEIDALAAKDAACFAEAMRLWDEDSDDFAIQAKSFSLTRAVFDNRVEAAKLSGLSQEEAEQYVLGYVVVQTLYSAALDMGITLDDETYQQHLSTNRQYIDDLIAADNPDDGSHYVKVFFDELEKNGVVDKYWELNTGYLWVTDMISTLTKGIHDAYLQRGGSSTDEQAWMQFCIDFTKKAVEAQEVQFAPDLHWELTGENYHSNLWPAL